MLGADVMFAFFSREGLPMVVLEALTGPAGVCGRLSNRWRADGATKGHGCDPDRASANWSLLDICYLFPRKEVVSGLESWRYGAGRNLRRCGIRSQWQSGALARAQEFGSQAAMAKWQRLVTRGDFILTVLYITQNGVTDHIGRSPGHPYLLGLAKLGFPIRIAQRRKPGHEDLIQEYRRLRRSRYSVDLRDLSYAPRCSANWDAIIDEEAPLVSFETGYPASFTAGAFHRHSSHTASSHAWASNISSTSGVFMPMGDWQSQRVLRGWRIPV